ncbi:MAG: XdhC family protein [Ilumatobacteraceae bacterium]
MYSVALSVASCLRAGTKVNVVWIVSADGLAGVDLSEGVALTPGGGRMGSLAGGVFDGQLADLAGATTARLVDVEISEVEALISGAPKGARATLAVAPADTLPSPLWAALLERRRLCLDATVDGRTITDVRVHLDTSTADNSELDTDMRELLDKGVTASRVSPTRVLTAFVPVTRLAISGGGPNATAIEQAAQLMGWQVQRATDTDTASGLMMGLSPIDAAVVMGHDVEASSTVLAAALESGAGYIGALGSLRMQQNRADWLAYRGITDLSRVHGPAGIDINARTPAEVAVSVVAEIVAVLNGPR